MSDLVSRQDAIRAFEGKYADDKCGVISATIVLESLPSVDREKVAWTPCSERLPDRNEMVLLCGYYNMMVGYWDEGYSGKEIWRVMDGDGCEIDAEFPEGIFRPLAWMPLPEPYKGGEEE